jgi:(p)ppGpp synthase/HD superfamily hydrolase
MPISATEEVQFHADFPRALAFATELHAKQKRKQTDIPYISHLISVAGIVLENGGSRDQALAALLHDAIEDQGEDYPGGVDALRRRIATDFGDGVLAIVEGCTDAVTKPKPDWQVRKEAYIEHLKTASGAVRLVSCSDKLHNARAILADLRIMGPSLWDRFTGGVKSLWYYRALADEFSARGPEALAQELERVVAEIECLSGITNGRRNEGGKP